MNEKEKRRFKRFQFAAKAILKKNGNEWTTTLLDICLNGVLVSVADNWQAETGDSFEMEIIFENSESLIEATVSLMHAENGRAGFCIESIDLDSISHLRRLVELNLGDSELLDRELSKLTWG